MGGQILFPWLGKDRRVAVRAHRLQGIAGGAALVAIVDEQRHAALGREAGRNRANGFVTRRRRLDDLAVAVECQAAGRDQHAAFDAAHMLADRKRIEELVGDE